MTRVNLVCVKTLSDQHLLAEHREIKRIPVLVKKYKVNSQEIPKKYVMWKWHVKFFYNKQSFLKKRYISLHNECLKRWFKVQNYINNWDFIDDELLNDYKPTKEEIIISKNRIKEKIKLKKDFYTFTSYK